MRRHKIVAVMVALAPVLLAACGTATGQPAFSDAHPPVPAVQVAAVSPHLVGGHPATQVYPWIVSMQFNYGGDPNFPMCTGSLYAPGWVRVNAHCATNQDGSPIDPAAWQLHVRVGSTDRTTGGDTATVTAVIPVPGWDWGQLDAAGRVDDYALLKLGAYLPEQPLDTYT